jgi:hypothetical protein
LLGLGFPDSQAENQREDLRVHSPVATLQAPDWQSAFTLQLPPSELLPGRAGELLAAESAAHRRVSMSQVPESQSEFRLQGAASGLLVGALRLHTPTSQMPE